MFVKKRMEPERLCRYINIKDDNIIKDNIMNIDECNPIVMKDKTFETNSEKEKLVKRKRSRRKIRRSRKNKKEDVNIMYSNIQGFNGKKESIQEILKTKSIDVCLLTETLSNKIKIEEGKSVCSKTSVGQNVCILLRNELMSAKIIKIYEPNENINMLGIRIELLNNHIRVYTAHLKQSSRNERDVINVQFQEIQQQFKQANTRNESMIAIMDVNAHVGSEGVYGCQDTQDWCGKQILELIKEEDLILVNNTDKCRGIVTRVDPRNGTETTIDLAICNKKTFDVVVEMEIDEEELFKPRCYKKKKTTKTDHHSIFIKLKLKKQQPKKKIPLLNKKDLAGQSIYKDKLDTLSMDEMFNVDMDDIDEEYNKFQRMILNTMKTSFKTVIPNNKLKPGVNNEARKLFEEERRVRRHVIENPQRGKQIHEIQNKIKDVLAISNTEKMCKKVEEITSARYPPAKVFQIRRLYSRREEIPFPLIDNKGIIRMEKDEIDDVIYTHFETVFQQNAIPKGKIWAEYWTYVEKVYDIIQNQCANEDQPEFPTYEEIKNIIQYLNSNKSVKGELSIELVKAGGDKMIAVIHGIINKCMSTEKIPYSMRTEKMILIHKKGEIMNIDNYRGIFLRDVILNIMQKWLFIKSSPILEENGSNYAYGGRKGKSTVQALLIIRLIQDHAEWTKSSLILKFLDIEKNFDSMNFKKALIMAHKAGLNGKLWTMYDKINKNKICEPVTSMGKGKSLNMNEIFVQGSSDAVIMAWNLMDELNKKEEDIFDEIVIVEGIPINRLLFVDDVVEVSRKVQLADENNIKHEVFQKENRIKYKTKKCKVIINMKSNKDIQMVMNNEKMEVKDSHKYLGTIISRKGRKEEMEKRVTESKGVANEIVEICKSTELSVIRMKYVQMLTNACFDMKIKYGCEFWDTLNKKQTEDINKIKINMM